LRRVEEEMLRDHVAHCVDRAVASGNRAEQRQKIEELMAVVSRVTDDDLTGIPCGVEYARRAPSSADQPIIAKGDHHGCDSTEECAEHDAVDPNPGRCQRRDGEQADPCVCGRPLRQHKRDGEADHEQNDERCRKRPSQSDDAERAIPRCVFGHCRLPALKRNEVRSIGIVSR